MFKEAISFHKYVGIPVVILMVIIWLLTGCGVERQYYHTETEREVIVTPETIEGVYQFEEVSSGKLSGALGITVDYQGKIDVEELETFRSQNNNGTFGTHPRVQASNLNLLNNRMVYATDITYKAENDLENDGTNTDLGAGKKYTIYTLYLNDANVLTLKIEIHQNASNGSGGINNLVITRIFEAVE